MRSDRPQVNGPALRAIREALGIPAAKMADDLGLSRSYLSMIEHGQRGCRASVIRTMACYLLVEPAAICTFAEPVDAA
jgi:transcriptional regulator with XRE-family HTH domain